MEVFASDRVGRTFILKLIQELLGLSIERHLNELGANHIYPKE